MNDGSTMHKQIDAGSQQVQQDGKALVFFLISRHRR